MLRYAAGRASLVLVDAPRAGCETKVSLGPFLGQKLGCFIYSISG